MSVFIKKPAPLALCLLLSACGDTPLRPASGVTAPERWQAASTAAELDSARDWWKRFRSAELDALIERARAGSQDVAAASARVRRARADIRVAGAASWPEVSADLQAERERLLSGTGNRDLDASEDDPSIELFDLSFSASYEVDFWGARAASQARAEQAWHASAFDRAALELSVLASVADTYLRILALRERSRIAELDLDNAQQVLRLVETRHESGAATALELAQQRSLVARQQRQLPLIRQELEDTRVALARLLGEPVQRIDLGTSTLADLRWPEIGAGLPSELLGRRPDIAAAEARLAAADADVQVARAALLPRLNLGASLGSGAERASHLLHSPFYTLTAGLTAPVFNHGRLAAQREGVEAERQALLHEYRGAILAAFADVETALNAIEGLDRQRHWQSLERDEAERAFRLAEERYRAGAETLLNVLETQRTLYQAQDEQVRLRLARLQASVALYKALGGGWREAPRKG
ncbi:efflux transporter outer membrane subunit [Pseudomonas sp. RIT-PI-AD]|uniref:efflux transporter outer membrane subunit n=1 Tax=Pseudomonas sp. RIT-PI-AD TaxID=3035294 RepID=UPI0023EF0059|nr:efflux transporter outer membrane subunit [Pseudomonas sp. RIT-PI-AD]